MERKEKSRKISGIHRQEVPEKEVGNKPDINQILDKHNSSIEKIIGKLLPGLDAVREVYDRDGDYVRSDADWNARTKVGTLILTAAGLMKTGGDNNLNIGIDLEEKKIEEMSKLWVNRIN